MGKICRAIEESIFMKIIAHMIEDHDEHDDASQQVDGFDAPGLAPGGRGIGMQGTRCRGVSHGWKGHCVVLILYRKCFCHKSTYFGQNDKKKNIIPIIRR